MSDMSIDTGDKTLDKAYSNMEAHISSFDDFESFYKYFLKIVKTDDKEHLNKWLCKVLFAQMKYKKHPFEQLLDLVDEKKKQELEKWVEDSIKAKKKA